MAIDSNVLQEVVDALKQDPEIKNNVYQATVSRIDGEGVVWVNIAGSDTETPTAITSAEVAPGDSVNVEWRNNKLYIGGNYSNPSAGVVRVANVEQIADVAVANASRAQTAAANAEAYAQDAKETADAVHDIAVQASQDADDAKDAAESAQGSADSALVGLSTVQDVVGVLNWITAHGTMTSQSGGTFDPDQVYFVMDDSTPGDYHVGSHYYSIVSEPKAADINSYYVLTVDESVQNYVATHIVVDSEGLWIIPDAGGNKVLIATGSGSTYTTAGTYIVGKVGGVDTVLAEFTVSGAQIGNTSDTHLEMDYHSMQLIDKEGNSYFYVSDLRDAGGEATLTYTDVVDDRSYYALPYLPTSIISVTINGQTASYVEYGQEIEITSTITQGDILEVVYTTESSDVKAYTIGTRNGVAEVGAFSYAEGAGIEASGFNSHAEGNNTSARGAYSHAQNYHTVAGYRYQTAIGNYNDNHANNIFEIGNGTADNARSNAFTVDWSGNVEAAGDVTDGAGTSIAHLLEVQNTYGVLTDLTGNTTLTASAKKLPLKTFSGNGCSLSSNGIKVTKAGTYLVSGTAYFHSGFTANDIIHLQLYKNSTLLEDFGVRMATASPYENVTLSPYIVTLSANDVMYLYAYNQTAARGQVNTGATRNFLMLNRIA